MDNYKSVERTIIANLLPKVDQIVNDKDISDSCKVRIIQKITLIHQVEFELWMFIPCDEDGNVLEEPEQYRRWKISHNFIDLRNWQITDCEKYQQAKDRILFKNVTYDNVKGQGDTKFYSVCGEQIFNIDPDGSHLYWNHNNVNELVESTLQIIEVYSDRMNKYLEEKFGFK